MKSHFWVKLMAGVSFICAGVLLGGCSWTMKDSIRDLKSRLSDAGVLQIEPYAKRWENNAYYKNKETYDDVLRDLTEVWMKNKPMMLSLSAIAIITGTIQLLASFSLLMSDSEKMQKPIRRWMVVHFVVFITLVILLLLTIIIIRQHGKTSNHYWSDLLDHFHVKLKEKQPYDDFTDLIYNLKKGLVVFYGSVFQDLVIMFFLFFVQIHFLRRIDYDYELHH